MRQKAIHRGLAAILAFAMALTGCAQSGQSTETEQAKPETTAAQSTEAPAQTTAPADTEAAAKEGGMPAELQAVYDALPAELQQALIPEDLTTDDDFLALTGTTMDEKDWNGASIADFDLTVIDCWSTWCGPCREMMPVFERVVQTLPANINVLAICFDGKAQTDTCRTIATSAGVSYPVILGDSAAGDPIDLGDYTMGIPTLLFINAKGQCIGRFVGRPLAEEVAEKDALAIIVYQALAKALQ